MGSLHSPVIAASASIVSSLLSLYILVLLVRIVIDWVQVFARSWRPTGVLLVLFLSLVGGFLNIFL